MVNLDMKDYTYSLLLSTLDEYGQEETSEPMALNLTVKMAIYLSSQEVIDSIKYKDADYIGLTPDEVNDTYIINYGDKKLKVLTVNPFGRFNQVFLKVI